MPDEERTLGDGPAVAEFAGRSNPRLNAIGVLASFAVLALGAGIAIGLANDVSTVSYLAGSASGLLVGVALALARSRGRWSMSRSSYGYGVLPAGVAVVMVALSTSASVAGLMFIGMFECCSLVHLAIRTSGGRTDRDLGGVG